MCRKPRPSIHGHSFMAVCRSGSRLRRRWFCTLSLVAGLAMIGVGMLLWHMVQVYSLTAVSTRVTQASVYLGGFRLALIGLLAILWPRLPALWRHAGADDDATRARWMSLRWRVVGWLLVIELVIGQNLIGRCFAATAGPTV